jgi:hypothetical protein
VALEARSLGVWRAGVGVLSLVAAASIGHWALRGAPPAAAALLLATVGLCAASLAPGPRFRLEWDGADWRLAWPAGSAAQAGRIEVCIDLGLWMLLRWRAGTGGASARWLPVHERDAAPRWRAWRAAVYSAAPAPLKDAVERGHDV